MMSGLDKKGRWAAHFCFWGLKCRVTIRSGRTSIVVQENVLVVCLYCATLISERVVVDAAAGAADAASAASYLARGTVAS